MSTVQQDRNVIPDRIADELGRFPPFSMLPRDAVRTLASEASVRVLVKGDHVWEQGERPEGELLFLARGRVEYVLRVEDRSELIDVRDVGDLLGLTALITGEPFTIEAQVVEDCILYVIPWRPVEAALDEHDAARNYVRRHLSWTTRVGAEVPIPEPTESALGGRSKNILQAHLDAATFIQPRPGDRLLTCAPELPVREAARLMAERRVPSILVVDEEVRPLGIVTNTMLVRHVIVAEEPPEEPVSTIMASPVVTVSAGSSATAALLIMLRRRIGQVCVTEDGTSGSRALDICSEKDLLAQSGHHPVGLQREFREARSPARFRELSDELADIARSYLEAGVSAIFIGQMCAELNDELVHRLIDLAVEETKRGRAPLPPVPWAWMSVGSDGRREQILRTDMDNAIVFGASGDPATDEKHRGRFTELGERVVAGLVTCGFSRCQGGVMASNPRWCRTDAEWSAELAHVEEHTEPAALLRALVLYDMRHVAGDESLVASVRGPALDRVADEEGIQRRLAELIIDTPPPLNFFGRFIVERRGSRAGEFDVKSRAMAPLRDAARLLSLHYRLNRRYSTGGRWDSVRRQVGELSELASLARDAYDDLMSFRTLNGVRRGDSGRFVDPGALTRMERARLVNAFDIVRMVQSAVRSEFALPQRLG